MTIFGLFLGDILQQCLSDVPLSKETITDNLNWFFGAVFALIWVRFLVGEEIK